MNNLTVAITPDATVAATQTGAGTNPSFANVRVNGSSTVNNAGTIGNAAPQNRDNFGVNLAGDLSTLNNTGTITLTAPAGNTTTGSTAPSPARRTAASTRARPSPTAGPLRSRRTATGSPGASIRARTPRCSRSPIRGLISATRGTHRHGQHQRRRGDRFRRRHRPLGRDQRRHRPDHRQRRQQPGAQRAGAAQYEITNAGVIANTTPGEAAIATFALNAGNAGATTTRAYNTVIVNTATGIINGDVRNTDQDLQTAATAVNLRRTGTLTNAGTINGNVAFGGGNQTVTNTGTITAASASSTSPPR